MVYRPSKRLRRQIVRGVGRLVGALRVTVKRRLQQTRTGQLRGSLRGRPRS